MEVTPGGQLPQSLGLVTGLLPAYAASGRGAAEKTGGAP